MDWKVKEGCFLLLYASLSVCLTSSTNVDVLVEKPKPVRVGDSVTLACTLQKQGYNVSQITWQKIVNDRPVNLGTYSAKLGAFITDSYTKVLNITTLGFNKTTITIWKAGIKDEGDYRCVYSVFGIGLLEGDIAVSVYEPPEVHVKKYNESADTITAECVASGWPPAEISWLGAGTGNQNGSRLETISDVTTFTHWIIVQTKSKSQLTEQLECRVRHMGKVSTYKIPIEIPDVLAESPEPVRVGEKVILKCMLQKKDYKAIQITWQKIVNDQPVTLGTYTTMFGAFISNSYANILNISTLGFNKTAITIWKAGIKDEGHYSCVYSVFKIGLVKGDIDLSVYEPTEGYLKKYNESSDSFTAVCVTSGWPPAEVFWIGVGTGNQNGSRLETTNDTVTLTHWIILEKKSKSQLDEKLECRAHHQGIVTTFKMTRPGTGLTPAIIILIIGLILVAIGAVAALCCRKK